MAAQACIDETGLQNLATPTRNRYFYGKLLDAYHFELEQCYFNRKRWLLNRLALGSGVLCGLQVALTNDGTRLVIGPGVAIDRAGREIIVPAASPPINPRQLTDGCGQPDGDRIAGQATVNICLAYHECEAEPVPVLVGDCDTREGCAPSLIRERYCIVVREGTPPGIAATCGFPGLFTPPPPGTPSSVYAELVKRISQPCAEPRGDPCVVLAQVNLPAEGGAITIDPTVRPMVYSNELLFELLLCLVEQLPAGTPTPAPVPSDLTTIKEFSWPHGQRLELDDFMRNGLTVTFTDDVEAIASQGDAWFIVTLEYPLMEGDLERPPLWPGTILTQRVLAKSIDIQNDTATFIPDPVFGDAFQAAINASGDESRPPLCRIVLKCNVLKGANGQAVDGDFLLGTLPTGDGVAGGDFESWFTLTR